MRTLLRSAVLVSLALLLTSGALAQNIRSAVSVTGVDTNTCTILDPCRTIGAALARTNNLGEVVVLSSGGYSPFVVNKDVSIVSPEGIHAALAPTLGAGISVNGPGVNVVLRNLWIQSRGGLDGIDVVNAATVHVESCTIAGFGRATIVLRGQSGGNLFVKDSFLRSSAVGIFLQPAGGVWQATIDRTRIEENVTGLLTVVEPGTTMKSVLRDSVVASGTTGVDVASFQGVSETNVENCVVAHHSLRGLQSAPTGLIRVSASYLTNNGTAVEAIGGGNTMISFGNNRFGGNGSDGTFTSTIPLR